jgi:mono/diheme cytochrome c family protein
MKNLTIFVFLAFLLPVTVSAQQMGPVTGDAENGALLFYQHGCYGCHGYSGYGRQDLNNTGSAILTNEVVFRAYLRGRQNVAPLLPSTAMPNYPANVLNDELVSNIYAYIRSMPENLPESDEVATLRAILESAQEPYTP